MQIRDGFLLVNNVNFYYEERGKKTDPAVLLINGMGSQLIYWPESLCNGLAEAGFRVIRFDNRDVGLSGDTPNVELLSITQSFIKYKLKRPIKASYTLDTMVSDAAGILDKLEVQQAHIAGFSMGGMIAQLFAATYPERTLSLTSFMSSTNEPALPGPKLNVLLNLLLPTAENTEAAIRARIKFTTLVGSPGFPRSLDEHARHAVQNIQRAYRPKASSFHKLAIMTTGGFEDRLSKITAPTLIVHGEDDVLVRPEGSKASAKAIPGAKLKLIRGMGHNFPDELVDQFCSIMIENFSSAQPV